MNDIHLENSHVRFTFDRATGGLTGLLDRRKNRQYLDGAGRLFRVIAPEPLWRSRSADSHESSQPEMVVSRVPGGQRLTIEFAGLSVRGDVLPVRATVYVELPDSDSEARFEMEIVNYSSDRLHEVHFPWVGGWDGPEESEGLCGVMPMSVKKQGKETIGYNLSGVTRREFVPYLNMQLPFFDVSGGKGGVSLICYQEQPNLGGMLLTNLDPEPDGHRFGFAWVHFPFVRPGTTWRSPAVGIAAHDGDWHQTADRFRRWLAPRWAPPKPPRRLAMSMGLQIIQLRNFDGQPNYRFTDIPKLAQDGLKYGVSDLCVWDPIAGVYLRPDDGDFFEEFDPSQSLDDLKQGLSESKKLGANVSVLLNYRLIREYSSLYRSIGEEQVQRTLHCAPMSDEWSNVSSTHASFRTSYLGQRGVALCQKPETFRKRAYDLTQVALDLGFTSLFIDQAFDYQPCLSEDHGHASPDDTHIAALEWFSKAADTIRSSDPDAYVLGETTDLFGLQYLDMTWNWAWASLKPEVIRYTLPETLHCWVVDRQPETLNRAFALGFQVALTTGMAEKSLAAYPEFGERVNQLGDLRARCAEYLIQCGFDDRLEVSGLQPAAGVYHSRSGLAVAVADYDGDGGGVEIRLDPEIYGRKTNGPIILQRQDGTTDEIGSAGYSGSVNAGFDLKSFEAAVLIVPCEDPVD